ncbi:MAG: TetR/AcrR family transcriptional regulator [Acidimicrobiales bacterium]
MGNPDVDWVRAPRQARSHETFERFVEATRQLLDEKPFDEITVADIVRKAERTVGSFYARFDDKYGVLYELMSRINRRITDVVRAFCDPVRWEGHPVDDFVAESVRLNVQAYRRTTPLFRAALCAASSDERFRRARVEVMQFCAEAQKQFLLSRVDELGCADPARASDQMFELVAATLDHELLFGRFTTTSPESDLDLIAELTWQSRQILGLGVITEPVS